METVHSYTRKRTFAVLFWFFAGLLSSLLLFGGEANAIEEHLVTPDRYKADDISLDPNEPITGYFHAGRSYECRVSQGLVQTASDDYIYFNTTITGPTNNIAAVPVGASYPPEARTGGADLTRQNLHRISFIPSETGVHTLSLIFDNARNSDGTVDCTETTLLGGFNSFFAMVPIVELRNRANAPLNATVTATDFDGVELDQQTIAVPASSRGDVILSVPANLFGTIRVTFAGSRGAIDGVVAEYDFGAAGSITLKRERPLRTTQFVP